MPANRFNDDKESFNWAKYAYAYAYALTNLHLCCNSAILLFLFIIHNTGSSNSNVASWEAAVESRSFILGAVVVVWGWGNQL